MKKFIILIFLAMVMTMTSCTAKTKKGITFEYINSEIEYCTPADEGHFEVGLILENGEKFVYHSTYDVTKIDKKVYINMGYDYNEKVSKSAVINPQQ